MSQAQLLLEYPVSGSILTFGVPMTEHYLPYGRDNLSFQLPDEYESHILEPGDIPGIENPEAAVFEELAVFAERFRRPSGSDSKRVAIAVNDKTRPVPHSILLPALLQSLENGGWSREEICFVIAVGAHAPMAEEEFSVVLPPELVEGCRVVSHDADDADSLTPLGSTSAGTPCRVNRLFAEAELRIVVGNIEPHQFMGWSGGVKSAAIGLASRETIAANHSMMAAPGAGPCRYEGNPVRQDVEEMGRLIAVDLALNVVMNRRKEIVAVLAGLPEEVMRRGIAVGTELFTASFHRPADLVIVSAGGFPKDINLYQAQKALRHAALAAFPGAPVIVVAACTEGIGSRLYEDWMADKDSHEQVKAAFEAEEFRLGHHKGMLFAGDALGRDVYLVSGLSDRAVSKLLLKPAASVEAALETIRHIPASGRVLRAAVMPYGNITIPVLRK